ncbi:MAG: CdaR family protein [Thermodesulfobacteriota bacterium]
MIRGNWHYRLLALVFAVFCWYVVSGQEKVDTWLMVPLDITNLPRDYIVRSGMPSEIQVRLRGTRAMLNRINSGDLSYSLDLSQVRTGENIVVLSPKNIEAGIALEVVELSPSRIDLNVDKMIARRLPVHVITKGSVPEDYTLQKIAVEPEMIQVKGPKSILEGMHRIDTREVLLSGCKQGVTEQKLGVLLSSEIEAEAGEVTARIYCQPKTTELWVKLPVHASEINGEKINLNPDHVRLKLELPLYLLRQEDWRNKIKVVLDGELPDKSGGDEFGYNIILPNDTRLLAKKPEKIKATFIRKD